MSVLSYKSCQKNNVKQYAAVQIYEGIFSIWLHPFSALFAQKNLVETSVL